jgi:hypothetical protein
MMLGLAVTEVFVERGVSGSTLFAGRPQGALLSSQALAFVRLLVGRHPGVAVDPHFPVPPHCKRVSPRNVVHRSCKPPSARLHNCAGQCARSRSKSGPLSAFCCGRGSSASTQRRSGTWALGSFHPWWILGGLAGRQPVARVCAPAFGVDLSHPAASQFSKVGGSDPVCFPISSVFIWSGVYGTGRSACISRQVCSLV